MKRFIHIIVAICLVLPMLVSCSDNTAVSDAPVVSSHSSNDDSTESDEQGSSSEEEPDTRKQTVVSVGKKYTCSYDPAASYPDSLGMEMTDGQYVNSEFGDYTDEKWTGYSGNSVYTFIINMGEDTENIYKFGVSAFNDSSTGVAFPSTVLVYSSDDGESWTKLGTAKRNSIKGESRYSDIAYLTLDTSTNAKYIKITVSRASGWLFLDELIVIADVEGSKQLELDAERIKELYNQQRISFQNISASVQKISTGSPDRSLRRTKITTNKTYTSAVRYSGDFTASSTALTDNMTVGTGFSSGNFVGYSCKTENSIVLTLDTIVDNIADFSASFFSSRSLSVIFPDYVDFFVSSDGKEYTQIGRIFAPTTAELSMYTYSLNLSASVSAKFIKLVLPASTDGSYYLIEELEAFSYLDTYDGGISYYPTEPIPRADEKVYYSPSDSDYNTVQNLLSGSLLYIYMGYNTELKGASMNSPVTSDIMSDGRYAKSIDDTDSFFCFYDGKTRDVVFDMGHIGSVNKIEASILFNGILGARLPESMNFYLSENGSDWYLVKELDTITSVSERKTYKIAAELDTYYTARYVRIEFAFSSRVYIDEVTAYGKKAVDTQTVSIASSPFRHVLFGDVGYLGQSENILKGAGDIVLLYYYDYNAASNNPLYGYEYDEILPYAAYLDENGKIKDTLFDGFLYMSSGTLKNGGSATGGADFESAYLAADHAFNDNTNIPALDKAVGDIKKELNLDSDYKAVYYLTICVPTKSTAYYDFDGDGTKDPLLTDEDCIKAIKMQINAFLELVNQHQFENVVFGGFYYFDESMSDVPSDKAIINASSEYANSLGYDLFWIPFNNATGYTQWANIGFDAVCLQPGYAFANDAKIDRIDYAANIAYRLNMCIEIEISNNALYDDAFFDRYMRYLENGIIYGYMNDAIHMYFQSYSAFALACDSTSPKARLIYDYTYRFIKGTLEYNFEKKKELEFSVSQGEILNAALGDNENGIVEYTILQAPRYGTVTICDDGSFAYYPDHAYTGTDTFTYTYNRQLGKSEPCTVKVNID